MEGRRRLQLCCGSRRLQELDITTTEKQQVTISPSFPVSFINPYLYAFFGFSPLLFLSFFCLFVSWDVANFLEDGSLILGFPVFLSSISFDGRKCYKHVSILLYIIINLGDGRMMMILLEICIGCRVKHCLLPL